MLPAMGLCGLFSLVGLVLGLIGLVVRKQGGASRGPALLGIACNGLCALLVSTVVGLGVRGLSQGSSSSPARDVSASRTVSSSGFRAANSQIESYADGQTAFGNTPEAVELARKFSTILEVMTRKGFTGGRADDTGTLTQGHVLTYVEMRAETVCFLVHVPELRSYRGEVRGTLLDLAWAAARESTRSRRPDRDVKLAVALRGIVFYGAISIGPLSSEKPQTKDSEGAASTEPLYAFFTGPQYIGPSPTPVATPTSTPSTPVPTPSATPDTGPRIRELRQRLRTGSLMERQNAAADLSNIGQVDTAAAAIVIPDLLNASGNSDPMLRLFALRALAAIQREQSLPVLIRAFEDPDPRVRSEAIRDVEPFSQHAGSAVPPLIRRSGSGTQSDRHAAVLTLSVVAQRVPAVRAEVIAALERRTADPDPLVRHWATVGIRDMRKVMAMETPTPRPGS